MISLSDIDEVADHAVSIAALQKRIDSTLGRQQREHLARDIEKNPYARNASLHDTYGLCVTKATDTEIHIEVFNKSGNQLGTIHFDSYSRVKKIEVETPLGIVTCAEDRNPDEFSNVTSRLARELQQDIDRTWLDLNDDGPNALAEMFRKQIHDAQNDVYAWEKETYRDVVHGSAQ